MVKANKKILLGLITVGVISNLQSNERTSKKWHTVKITQIKRVTNTKHIYANFWIGNTGYTIWLTGPRKKTISSKVLTML